MTAIGLAAAVSDRALWSVGPFVVPLWILSALIGIAVGVVAGAATAVSSHSVRAGANVFSKTLLSTVSGSSVGLAAGWLLGKPFGITPTLQNVPESIAGGGGLEKAFILLLCWFFGLAGGIFWIWKHYARARTNH